MAAVHRGLGRITEMPRAKTKPPYAQSQRPSLIVNVGQGFMQPSSSLFAITLLLAAACLSEGCTHPVQQRLPAVAVAIRPVDDRPPSTVETQLVLQALKPALLQAGASIAERGDPADFVMTVSFIPATESSASRVKVIGIEPTPRFRDATDGADSPEAKDWRRRLRDIEQWVEREGRRSDI